MAFLTATDISGPGWTCTLGSLTCTRNDPLTIGYPSINETVNVAANAPSSGTNTATVFWAGDIYPANNTSSDMTTILPPVSITVMGTGMQTVKAGGNAVFGFSIVANAPGTASLRCIGLPNEATCSFNPATVTGTTTATLTITTTAPSAGVVWPLSPHNSSPRYAVLFSILVLAVLTLGLTKPARVRLRLATCTASLAVLVLMAGCGGRRNPGTSAGTYTITVNANGPGNLQGTTTVTLTVQ